MKLLNSDQPALTKDNVQEYLVWYLKKHWHKVKDMATFQANLYILEHILRFFQTHGAIDKWIYTPNYEDKDVNIHFVYNYYYAVASFRLEMP